MTLPVGLEAFLNSDGPMRPAVLADLDGCLISEGQPLPFVDALFARCGERLWIVSNNSTDTSQGLALRLCSLGLPVTAARCLLAGEETLRRLALEKPGARVALFASAPLQRLAVTLGLILDKDRPDVVVLARDTGLRFDNLTQLMAFVHRGLEVWLTNPDPFHPAPDGTPVPETGAIWAAVAAAAPEARFRCLGKPAPDMPVQALLRAGVSPADAIFIGDTPETDGASAQAAGVAFVLLHRPGHRQPILHDTKVQAC